MYSRRTRAARACPACTEWILDMGGCGWSVRRPNIGEGGSRKGSRLFAECEWVYLGSGRVCCQPTTPFSSPASRPSSSPFAVLSFGRALAQHNPNHVHRRSFTPCHRGRLQGRSRPGCHLLRPHPSCIQALRIQQPCKSSRTRSSCLRLTRPVCSPTRPIPTTASVEPSRATTAATPRPRARNPCVRLP